MSKAINLNLNQAKFIKCEEQVVAFFGGICNGKTFAENYGKDYNNALNGAVTRQDDDVQRALTIKQEDAAAKLAYMEAEHKTLKMVPLMLTLHDCRN